MKSERARGPAILAAALACAAAALSGCSLTTEALIRHQLGKAGFRSSEAKCATKGALAHLTPDQLWSIRSALLEPDRPAEFADAEALLAWLQPRIEPEPHRVLAHYTHHCRRRA